MKLKNLRDFKVRLAPAQYELVSRVLEDVAKGVFLSVVVGHFLPSVLPSAIEPTRSAAIGGFITALTFLYFAAIFVERGKNV
jgi:hypothetical protein